VSISPQSSYPKISLKYIQDKFPYSLLRLWILFADWARQAHERGHGAARRSDGGGELGDKDSGRHLHPNCRQCPSGIALELALSYFGSAQHWKRCNAQGEGISLSFGGDCNGDWFSRRLGVYSPRSRFPYSSSPHHFYNVQPESRPGNCVHAGHRGVCYHFGASSLSRSVWSLSRCLSVCQLESCPPTHRRVK
jgi:hypothetical protein